MKFGGGGGMKDLQKMMKQAQKMQADMMEQQSQLESKEYEGVAGGAVRITITGKYDVTKVSIDPDAVDADDVEGLEEMVMMAFNDAVNAARKDQETLMQSLTAGMPGLGGLGF